MTYLSTILLLEKKRKINKIKTMKPSTIFGGFLGQNKLNDKCFKILKYSHSTQHCQLMSMIRGQTLKVCCFPHMFIIRVTPGYLTKIALGGIIYCFR